MQIEIPFKTPSINHLYFNWHNRRILSAEARKLKEEIKLIVLQVSPVLSFPARQFKVSIDIYENWYNIGDGKVARKDLDNRAKFIIDAVFDALEINDKYIFEETFKKIQSNEEKAIITIEEICENN